VNAIIPYKMAKIAEESGVKKFIYISTVAVFGSRPDVR
jgi:dTDP-4-dehydrorhamnose reductase